jgi:CubicO group peptidase (beta-lactamase class C family)
MNCPSAPQQGAGTQSAAVCLPPFDTEGFQASADRVFVRALTAKTFSGASLLVAKPDRVLFHQTWGHTRNTGESSIDSHTLFDLASITKPLITVPLCARAVSEGILALDDPLRSFFPSALITEATQSITIRQLLTHSSGLPAYEPFFHELIPLEPSKRREALRAKVLSAPLQSRPGTSSCYSDLGFMLLTMILEGIYEAPLDHLAEEFLLQGFEGTLRYCPLEVPSDPTVPPKRPRAAEGSFAATEYCPWRKRLLEAEAHDENAYCLGGVAGHAGLFGTAHGVFRLLAFLWELYQGSPDHPPRTTEVMREFWTRPSGIPDSTWMLGFDTPSPQQSSAGDRFSPRSAGHLGFTGTSFWFDLEREILIILLTNRVHPTRKNERMKSFRPLLHNLVMEVCLADTGCE